MIILISSLSFAGYTLGAFRYYRLVLDGNTYNIKDSVFLVGVWDGSGTRCSFSVDMAKYVSIYSYTYSETTIVYFDGTYLVEDFEDLSIKHLKFPLIVGNTWQAMDTCFYPLNEFYPYKYVDSDSIIDSIYVRPANAELVRISGDTVEIHISGIYRKIKWTSRNIVSIDTSTNDTLFEANYTLHDSFNLRITYIANFGYISFRVDTLYRGLSYDLIHTSPYDSTHIPPIMMPVPDHYIKTLSGVNISESVRDKKEEEMVEIYDVGGRLVYPPDERKLKRGIYFIRRNNKIEKRVILH